MVSSDQTPSSCKITCFSKLYGFNYSIYHVFVRFWEIFFLAHFLFFQESMIFIGDGLALIGPYIQSEKNQSKSLTIDFWLIGDSKIGDFSHAYFNTNQRHLNKLRNKIMMKNVFEKLNKLF